MKNSLLIATFVHLSGILCSEVSSGHPTKLFLIHLPHYNELYFPGLPVVQPYKPVFQKLPGQHDDTFHWTSRALWLQGEIHRETDRDTEVNIFYTNLNSGRQLLLTGNLFKFF